MSANVVSSILSLTLTHHFNFSSKPPSFTWITIAAVNWSLILITCSLFFSSPFPQNSRCDLQKQNQILSFSCLILLKIESQILIYIKWPCSPLIRFPTALLSAHALSVILASLLFLKQTKYVPFFGSLQFPFLLPSKFFPQYPMDVVPSFKSLLKCHSDRVPFLTTCSKLKPSSPYLPTQITT